MPAEDRQEIERAADEIISDAVWVPNPGPQTEAYLSEADELFYGGEAGGGKTDLLIGAALTAHQDSILFRRTIDDAKDLAIRARDIAGEDAGYNGQDKLLSLGHRKVRFGGLQYEEDAQRQKGRPRDLYGFDEIGDFSETQYLFVTTWNRSAKNGPDGKPQRCRIICTGNPPTTQSGLWVTRYWGAWLDPAHPNPAKEGELRWYIRGAKDEDIEVDGPGPHVVEWDHKAVYARSRTFIRAGLKDNPDLTRDPSYEAQLDSLPALFKDAYRDGKFKMVLRDEDSQVIPTEWIMAAQARWKPDGWQEFPMTAMALDPAGGGLDSAALAYRHGGWFGELDTAQGVETKDGSHAAGMIVKRRKAGCPVVVDVGGGYAGAVMQVLKENSILVHPFNGANTSTAKTRDGTLRFKNKRAEAVWKLREDLDPEQEGGSPIALPPDPELLADLASFRFEPTAQGLKLGSKDDQRDLLGRSPGKGDAVVMCYSEGNVAVRRKLSRDRMGGGTPRVVRQYAHMKNIPR